MNDVKPSAFVALIDEIKGLNRWSDTDIANEAMKRRPDLRLSKQDISGWRNSNGMKTLSPLKVIAVAAGLHLPAYRVALAVIADQGIHVPADERTPEVAIHQDPSLTAHTKDAVLHLIEKDRQEQVQLGRQATETGGPQPMDPVSP